MRDYLNRQSMVTMCIGKELSGEITTQKYTMQTLQVHFNFGWLVENFGVQKLRI